MTNDVIRAYHERTKHGFGRFARSLGYLDWANQPEPFRWFDGAPRIELAFGGGGEAVAWDDLHSAGSVPAAPLDAVGIADLFFHSLAVSAIKQAGAASWALRVNPSSGNLHPTEAYAILPAIPGIGDRPGVYHYLPRDHVLERRAALSEETFAGLTEGLPDGSFLVALSSIHWREAWKYGERAFRYCQHDTGHAIAAIRLAAAMRGWHVRVLSAWSHDAIATVLGLDREGDFPDDEEGEEPELIAAVTPVPPAAVPAAAEPRVLEAMRTEDWAGEANLLSDEHMDWDVIEEAAVATRSPGCPDAASAVAPAPWPGGRPERDARSLLRARRSAVMFDGKSSIPLDGFARILLRTLPGAPPFDALPWSPRIHLALFVHRVDDLAPGVYLLARDASAADRLRAAMHDEFEWARPDGLPDGLPLVRLARRDVRGLAARLSCTQEIAGASFFSLGMLADYDASLAEHGPSFYRNLFWEAGAVGQVLYLEAEAEGARGTGIGCYFDDPVHEVLGLRDRAFQSLYHFTIGIPVADDRLTTLAPYPDTV